MSALGLGGYDSSDDEIHELTEPSKLRKLPIASRSEGTTSGVNDTDIPDQVSRSVASSNTENGAEVARAKLVEDSDQTAQLAVVGPSLPSESFKGQSPAADVPEVDPSLSPYSRVRQQVRMLTMPSIPSFEIPPSPPAGDPSSHAVSNKKVRHFLELKQRGVHFNQRLSSSNALRNPSMTSKLMDFAGIEGVMQYDHALPEGLGVDVRHWAGLRVEDIVSQMEDARRREANGRKGKPREFVSGIAESNR